MSRRQRHLGYRLAAGGLAAIALLTLLPHPDEAPLAAATPLSCIVCGQLGVVDVFLNVLLFIPLGLGLALAGFSWRRTLVLAALLSFSIELLQMKVVAGRDASLGDLLTNTLGGGLGALLAARWRAIVLPSPRGARRLTLACALGLGAVWAGTARALAPMWPAGAAWYGQWAADLGHLKPFLGTPLAISAGGEPLLPGRALDQSRLQDAVEANPSLAVRAVLGPPTPGLAPIGSIYDRWQREVILLGQDHRDLEFRLRMHAVGLGLRNPTVALPEGLAGQPGDTIEAEAALTHGRFQLTARNGSATVHRELPLSASWGWSLVLPWHYALGSEVHFLTALWVAGLVAALAYWSMLADGAARAVAPVTTAVLLGVIPYGAGFPPAHWSEWVAAAVGIVLGVWASGPARRARAADPASAAVEEELSMRAEATA